jgi:hypothetical protein
MVKCKTATAAVPYDLAAVRAEVDRWNRELARAERLAEGPARERSLMRACAGLRAACDRLLELGELE